MNKKGKGVYLMPEMKVIELKNKSTLLVTSPQIFENVTVDDIWAGEEPEQEI